MLGSISSAIILCKLIYGVDIREVGSRNPGANNVQRVFGIRAGITVFLFDFFKGWAAVKLIGFTTIGTGSELYSQIQILLTDWDSMFRINTSKKQFVDFDNDPRIIAHGSLVSADADDGYVEFTIPLVYRNDRTPKYIVVVAAASRYGDYFTGAVGSVLKVDEFELIYDPAELTEEEFAEVFSRMPMN